MEPSEQTEQFKVTLENLMALARRNAKQDMMHALEKARERSASRLDGEFRTRFMRATRSMLDAAIREAW